MVSFFTWFSVLWPLCFLFQVTVIFIFVQVGFFVISFGSLLLLVAAYILTQGLTPNNVKLVSFTSQQLGTHGLIFFDHYYNPNSRFFLLRYQPRLFPALSLPGFLFFGHCVSYFKLKLFLFSYKSVSVLYRSGRYFF
jgi:hypothetical protein